MYIDVLRSSAAWLAQVNHDLVKRLLWPARDRRDLGGPVGPGELRAALTDDDGNPVTAGQLWALLRADAPAVTGDVLETFGRAIEAAERAAAQDDLTGVLGLEGAFQLLAQNVKEATAAPPPGDSNRSR